jgi:hypothetical protein
MPRQQDKPEEVIKLLRLVEIEVGQGRTTGQACKWSRLESASKFSIDNPINCLGFHICAVLFANELQNRFGVAS